MSKRRVAIAFIVGLLLMIACASPVRLEAPGIDDREIPFEHRVAMAESNLRLQLDRALRLQAVSHRLRFASATACSPQLGPMLEFVEANISDYENDPVFEQAVSNLYGLEAERTIVGLSPGGPMERAGARVGDQLLRIGGRRLGTKNPRDLAAKHVAKSSEPIPIQLARQGETVDIQLEPVLGCRGEDQVYVSDDLCVRQDFRRVSRKPARWDYSTLVCTGLLEFVRSDDELASLLAHMLAHQVLETTGKPKTAHRYRTVRRPFVGQGLELRADELGLELLAGAGYDITVAPDVLERIALEYPITIVDEPGSSGSSHIWNIGVRLPPMRRHIERLMEAGKQAP